MNTLQTINLTDLLLNTENYRFTPVSSQKEAINQMIENQQENLVSLATDILERGLNPNDKICVIESTVHKGKYVVIEGNRRTIALKLVNNPDLIENSSFSSLKKKFKDINSKFSKVVNKKIECYVFEDLEDLNYWVGLKHGYGKSGVITDQWDSIQKQRYSANIDGVETTGLQLINFAKSIEDIEEDVKASLDSIKITNIQRLLDDPDVRKKIGLEIKDGLVYSELPRAEVAKGVKKLINDVLDPNFKVNNIYSKEDRLNYIKSFTKTDTPNPKMKADSPWALNEVKKKLAIKIKSKNTPTIGLERKTLIPKNCRIEISKPKPLAIFRELSKISVKDFPNSAGVLLRVFVELSVDTYIEEYKLTSALTAAGDKTKGLLSKVGLVTNHLDQNGFIDKTIAQGIRTGVKDHNGILGIDVLHAYVHNNRFSPIAESLIITWDNIQEFMVILWEKIK